jgi:hypothetical protein
VGGVAALVRFQSRTVACGALLGWKAVTSGRVNVAPGTLCDAEKAVTLSLLISLNRNYKDDATLSRVLVPKVDVTEVVQQQERPGYLPPPPVVTTASVLPDSPSKRPAVESVEDLVVIDPVASKRQCVDSAPSSSFESCSDLSSSECDSEDEDEEELEDRVVMPVAIALPQFSSHDKALGSPSLLSDASEDLAGFLGLDMFEDADWPADSFSMSPLDSDPIDFDAFMSSLVA